MYQSTQATTYVPSEDKNSQGKSQKVGFIGVVKSSFKMNLEIMTRYKANLLGGLLEFLVIMFVFTIFAFALVYKNGYEWLTESDIFIFYMGAILIMTFNSTAIWTPITNVQRDIYNGTLGYLYFNPSSKYGYFVGSILADGFIKFSVLFIPVLGILVFVSGIFDNPEAIAGVFAISMIILVNFIAMGVLVSLSAILWKQVNAIAGILNTLFQFLAGAFFPINAYPESVRFLAYLLPHTYGYDLVRYFSFRGHWTTIFPVEIEIAVLLFFTVVYLSLSIILLKKTEHFAKKTGLHRI